MAEKTRVALITGASSGIGEALALRYAQLNFNLVLLARRIDRLSTIQKTIQAKYKEVRTIIHPCDVTQPDHLRHAVAQALQMFGGIDVVIANAGFGVTGAISDLSVEDFRRQFETNVFGVLNTIYATLGSLKTSRGKLALIGSVNSYLSEPKKAPYCMSKFAVKALADSLHRELASEGISVTLICPGVVESEIRKVDRKGLYHPHAKEGAPRWLIMDRHKAARQITRAIEKRKREKVVTRHGVFIVWLQRFLPGLVSFLLRHPMFQSRRTVE